jgi:hypothetical protein
VLIQRKNIEQIIKFLNEKNENAKGKKNHRILTKEKESV